jgi:hypothetical protein
MDEATEKKLAQVTKKSRQDPEKWAAREVGYEVISHTRLSKETYAMAQALIARRRARGEKKLSISTLFRTLLLGWIEEQLREEPLPCHDSTQS